MSVCSKKSRKNIKIMNKLFHTLNFRFLSFLSDHFNKYKTWWLFFIFLFFNSLKLSLFLFFIIHELFFIFFFFYSLINIIFLIFLLPLIVRNKFIFIFFYIIQFIYISVNLLYYLYFDNYLSIVNAFQLIREGTGAIASIIVIKDAIKILICLIDIPALIIFFRHYYQRKKISFYKSGLYIYLIIISIGILGFIEYYNQKTYKSLVNRANRPKQVEEVWIKRYGLLINNVFDVLHHSNEKALIANIKYGPLLKYTSKSKNYNNIIVIQLESVDSHIIEIRHKGKYVMPFLKSLTTNSIFFPYAVTYHSAGATSDAEFSAINGAEPFKKFIAFKMNNYDYPNSFFKKLNKFNYLTVVIHGNRGDYFNRFEAYKFMGLKKFYDLYKMNIPSSRITGWGARDEDLFNYSKKMLHHEKNNYYYHIITVSSHSPFNFIKKFYKNPHFDDIPDVLFKNYFTSMAYVDMHVKNFIEYVRKYFPDVYIFMYGDHTPGKISYKDYIAANLYHNNIRFEFVPLYILTPDSRKHYEKNHALSFMDLSPTILKLSGISFQILTFGEDIMTFKFNKKIIKREKEYSRQLLYKKISEYRAGNIKIIIPKTQ